MWRLQVLVVRNGRMLDLHVPFMERPQPQLKGGPGRRLRLTQDEGEQR